MLLKYCQFLLLQENRSLQFYFYSFWPKQQREASGEEGGGQSEKRLVDRLGAWIWDKAWRQRKLENSPGWNKGCAPCTPPPPPKKKLPPFPPAVLLTDGSKGGWVDGLEGLKTLQSHFGAWRECHSCKGGVQRSTCGESHGACEEGARRLMSKEARMLPVPRPPLCSIHLYPLRSEERGAAKRGGSLSITLIELPLINQLICRGPIPTAEPPSLPSPPSSPQTQHPHTAAVTLW